MTASIKAVASAVYYLCTVVIGYYLNGGDPPGRWSGRGAAALNLAGQVLLHPFARVLSGRHPTTRERLTKVGKLAHRPGFDVTFQVPKSVSALWAVADRPIRTEIEAAIDRSISAVLQWFEDQIPLTRRGKAGCRRELARLVMAEFDHVHNRNGDPLLHRHVVIANVCERLDGTWGTIDSKTLYNWIRTIGPMFRANLAHELRLSLGLELVAANDNKGKESGWFEVAGVSTSLTKQWSSRRHEMIEELEGKGQALGQSSARARANSAVATRQPKAAVVPREDDHARWREEAAKHGFTPEKAMLLLGQARLRPTPEAYAIAWKGAIASLSSQHAHFTERRMIQEVCERLQTGHFTGLAIAEQVRTTLSQSPDIVPLKDAGGDRQYATKATWELEARLFQEIDELKAQPGAQLSKKQVDRILERHKKLDNEQVAAVRELLTAHSAIRILSGIAGSGKSTTLRAVKEAYEAAGYRVIGGALSGVAKEELAAKTGMKVRTIASYERSFEKSLGRRSWDRTKHVFRQYARAARGKQTWTKEAIKFDRKTVFILDEAWMLGTKSLHQIAHQVVKSGGTLLCCGDGSQLQPIEAGAPMRDIAKQVPHSHLSINRRQKDEQDQKAVQAIREGDAAKALENYAARGLVTIGTDKRDTIRSLIAAWKSEGGVRRPEDFAVFTQTRQEAREVNRQCQAERLAAARIPQLAFVSNGQERFYRGDRVMFHAPKREYGGIENGFRGTILSIDPIRGEAKVRLDTAPQPTKVRKTRSQIVTVPVREFGDEISLGYASTTHKGQSQTVKNALLLMGGDMLDRELAYTQVTRAEHTTRLFVDKSHAGHEYRDLIAAIEKSRVKTTAHSQVDASTKRRIRGDRPNQGPDLVQER